MKEIKRLKNVVILAATFFAAATLHGASIGFFLGEFNEQGVATTPTLEKWDGCLSYFFVQGQKGVDSVQTVLNVLNQGSTDFSTYALGSAAVESGHVQSASLNPSSLGAGTYTAFAILFDAKNVSDITSESTKYLVLAGSQMTQTITSSDIIKQFTHSSAGTVASNESSWRTFGVVPEPTSGVMLLLGVAALALKRKRG